ncbi:O-antigen export protein [Segetibacter aerophilus]|uniref:O-antigen export protein n=1 Tax=Segetibacter aerophilus TaxID=670293 RepID=A0A512BD42_9BACT|nr:O-antigen export protein [Segetibacter aerophilus]
MLISFAVKGGSILIGLILIPLTINYINAEQYGIWLTISSIISWMSFFDIGMGNGLRNKLTQCLALEDYEEANKFVSTAYVTFSIIGFVVFIVFYTLSAFFDWSSILNIHSQAPDIVRNCIVVVLGGFCIQFTIQTINTVLLAIHQNAKSSVITFIGQVIILITIYILTHCVPGSLIILVTVLTVIPIIVMMFASLFLYRHRLRSFRPRWKNIHVNYVRSLLNLGGVFFVIQIGALILFQTDNIIITRILGPKAVTTFNVSYKLFSAFTMVFSIIVTPYWSAFTDAYAKQDFSWMSKSIKSLRQIWLVLSLATLVLLTFSKVIYGTWLGNTVAIPISLSFAMAAYVIVFVWQTLHVYMLNGIGKVRLQLILVVASAIINIPLAVFLGKKFGLAGIISANTIVFIVMGVVFSIQVQKILTQKAEGIWNR